MDDTRWMLSALALARRSLGQTWPNPAVGAILVRDGIVLGRGATATGGRPHAEVLALKEAGARGHDCGGATAYVTLEPCAHHGQTPPCTDALIDAGIVRVVCPLGDPDPRVSGRGFARLRDADIAVELGLCASQAVELNLGFLKRIRQGLPCVTLKIAASLDGRIATRTGQSQWITGPAARRYGHLMRAQHDAILIGAGTARADNPSLNVRCRGLEARAPVRVVVDTHLTLPPEGVLAQTADKQPLMVFHGTGASPDRADRLRACGAELVPGPVDSTGRLTLLQVLTNLGSRGITRVLCEGGGQMAASLLTGDLVDEIAMFSAGVQIGGDGLPAVASLGLDALSAAPRFDLAGTRSLGTDLLTTWHRAAPSEADRTH